MGRYIAEVIAPLPLRIPRLRAPPAKAVQTVVPPKAKQQGVKAPPPHVVAAATAAKAKALADQIAAGRADANLVTANAGAQAANLGAANAAAKPPPPAPPVGDPDMMEFMREQMASQAAYFQKLIDHQSALITAVLGRSSSVGSRRESSRGHGRDSSRGHGRESSRGHGRDSSTGSYRGRNGQRGRDQTPRGVRGKGAGKGKHQGEATMDEGKGGGDGGRRLSWADRDPDSGPPQRRPRSSRSPHRGWSPHRGRSPVPWSRGPSGIRLGPGRRSSSPKCRRALWLTPRRRIVWRRPAAPTHARPSRIWLRNATGIKPRIAESGAGRMHGLNFDVRGLICRRIFAEEASTLILASNYAGAWTLLQEHPGALGVTAPSDSPGAGYGLLHTCLVRNTPDWFMGFVFNRTAQSVCLEATGRRTGSTALHFACSSSWVRIVKELARVLRLSPHRGLTPTLKIIRFARSLLGRGPGGSRPPPERGADRDGSSGASAPPKEVLTVSERDAHRGHIFRRTNAGRASQQ